MPEDRPSDHLKEFPPPISEVPWSTDFVMQAIELLPVRLREGGLVFMKPEHADSFVVGWPAGERPESVASRTLDRLGLDPVVLHSTSWRHAGDEVVLTYIAVVTPGSSAPVSFAERPVARAVLARGDAVSPPPIIESAQVLEHALRHLAWLVEDDPAIAAALPTWKDVLESYVPEPFRTFGPATETPT